MYVLPESHSLTNKLIKERLEEHGYTEVDHTPGLFKHENRPIWFTLTVDDFGVKYVGEEHSGHLMDVLKLYYNMEEDWKGELYCVITLNWNYDEGYVEISMPNYVTKKLTEYGYKPSKHSHPIQIF